MIGMVAPDYVQGHGSGANVQSLTQRLFCAKLEWAAWEVMKCYAWELYKLKFSVVGESPAVEQMNTMTSVTWPGDPETPEEALWSPGDKGHLPCQLPQTQCPYFRACGDNSLDS
jgi:hypothetical protein